MPISMLFDIRDAMVAAGCNCKEPELSAPATPEAILRAVHSVA
jgi:xanthine dehydrogenase molybdopterin-binding subunit B